MVGEAAERVGVVVIHGVGDTTEGWIDDYLVPDLQRWSAYNAAGKAPTPDAQRDMVLVARTGDGHHIAIALDTDAHFQSFCRIIGMDHLRFGPDFQTPAKRFANRDKLVDMVADVAATRPAAAWLSALAEAGVPATPAFDPRSQVHRVRDPESSDPTRTWKSYARVWPLPGREVQFTELYWADMSNVGKTIGVRLLAVFELVVEAPFFLGRALLRDSQTDVHRAIRALVIAANWLMRWPVSGLNAAIFSAAVAAMFVVRPEPMSWLPMFVAATLAVMGFGGLLLCRRLLHRRPGLADLALSTGLNAILLLALLGLHSVFNSGALPTTPEPYLVYGILLLLIAWTAWTVPIVLAILLIGLVGAKRLVLRRRPTSPPLARPAAAVGLNIVLAMLYKFLFAAFGILVITTLVAPVPASGPGACAVVAQKSSTQFWSSSDLWAGSTSPCQLAGLKRLLLDVSAFNALAIALLVAAILALVATRLGLKRVFRTRAAEGRLRLPRLIAHPLIMIMLFVGALANTAVIYVPGIAELRLPSAFLGVLRQSGLEHLGAGALIILVAILLAIIEASDSFLHIGRDLVDHQYDRNPRSAAVMVAEAGPRRRAAVVTERKRYRRRARIQRRLEALIDDVIANQHVDRLIFVAHSQGTVILRDYLLDHDRLMSDREGQAVSMRNIRSIDVVTLGSPLTHIYKHYFSDDNRAFDATDLAEKPMAKVRSWTNLWRIDDPIGQDVDLSPIGTVTNRGIAPGGHTEYWKEAPVCEVIHALITAPPAEQHEMRRHAIAS